MPGTDKIIIYCDGACSGNQYRVNAGGWGAILRHRGTVKEIYGGELNTTNQRMELTACIKALEMIKSPGRHIDVYTDSAYLVNCIQRKWYLTWQKNGWKNANRQPVENRDLWERLLALLSKYKVVLHKVAGHAGDELNERADELARLGISHVKKIGLN
ncbi:MAG: ribonuclease HI [Dehalococcoidia bacterium]